MLLKFIRHCFTTGVLDSNSIFLVTNPNLITGRLLQLWILEGFHSLSYHLRTFIGTKESVYIRKVFNSHETGLEHQHGHHFIVQEHQYGRHDVMWKRSIVIWHRSSKWGFLLVIRNLATLETRRELESKCISQLYLGSLLGTRQTATGQLGGLSVRRDLNTGRTSWSSLMWRKGCL